MTLLIHLLDAFESTTRPSSNALAPSIRAHSEPPL